MKNITAENLVILSEKTGGLQISDAVSVLDTQGFDLLSCLMAAYQIRLRSFGKEVTVHILNNVQNGLCREDCHYCAQSSSSEAAIESYPMKPEAEILAEAKAAYEQGAYRYCMVFSGTGASDERVNKLTKIIKNIKALYPIEVCVSTGTVDARQAAELKAAGLDRLNHNLNTSERYYSSICSTHSFSDRIATLHIAKAAGLAVCSGVILGMGETTQDVYDMAVRLREVKAESIPVNFFIPIPGAVVKEAQSLTPEYCLRALCLFRLMNPASEIRMAAGREMHLRSLEALGLYAANSLFLQGYLNARGSSNQATLQMIKDAGFTIKSEISIDQLLSHGSATDIKEDLKTISELRPYRQ